MVVGIDRIGRAATSDRNDLALIHVTQAPADGDIESRIDIAAGEDERQSAWRDESAGRRGYREADRISGLIEDLGLSRI